MKQNPKFGSEFQSLIEKYRAEMLSSYERKTLPDMEPATPTTAAADENVAFNESIPVTEDVPVFYSPVDIEPVGDASMDFGSMYFQPMGFECTDSMSANCIPTQTMAEAVVEMTAEAVAEMADAEEMSAEPKYPTANVEEDEECPPPPSMLRPQEAPARQPFPDSEGLPTLVAAAMLDDDNSPPPSMLRPYTDAEQMISAMDSYILDASSMDAPTVSESTLLQIHVTSARKAVPVRGARVIITREGSYAEAVQRTAFTDSSGNTPLMVFPACDPPAPCTIEIAATGFCRVRYARVPLPSSTTLTQEVDLIPLPAGEKPDFEILYDELPVG